MRMYAPYLDFGLLGGNQCATLARAPQSPQSLNSDAKLLPTQPEQSMGGEELHVEYALTTKRQDSSPIRPYWSLLARTPQTISVPPPNQ